MILTVAEIGPNHDGKLEEAIKLVDAALNSGATAVKFQAHIAEAESLRTAPPPPYFDTETPFDFFKRTSFNAEQWLELREYVDGKCAFICSPFSIEAVDLMEEIEVDAYKIASGEVTNTPLLQYIAKKNRPVYLSSGMSNWNELDAAVTILQNTDLTIMQCSSEYPCPYERVGLNLIGELKRRYGKKVGLSDHTLTTYTAIAAVVLGVTVIEKHFTLTNEGAGPDFAFSLTPDKFKDLVEGVRAVEKALIPVDKWDVSRYEVMKNIFQKSVTSLKPIPVGVVVTRDDLALRKPGDGLPPEYLDEIIGKTAKRFISPDSVIYAEDINW